jgi:HEAT repeat protein
VVSLLLLALQELLTPGEIVLAELARDPTPVLLKEAAEIYRFPYSEAERAALFEAIGRASKDKRIKVRVAALLALAETGNEKAGPLIEPHLREKNPSPEEKQVLLTAVDAVGRLKISSLIPSLMQLAKSSKDMTVADQALLAIGRFHDSNPRERKALVEKVLALAKSLKRSRGRWRRLSAPTLRCLQLLTGMQLNTVELFAAWWKVAKEKKDPFTPSADGS